MRLLRKQNIRASNLQNTRTISEKKIIAEKTWRKKKKKKKEEKPIVASG